MGNNFTKKYEGYSSKVYNDTEGNPTIGEGINLNSPGARQRIEQSGLDYDRVLAGEQELTPELSDLMHNDIRGEKQDLIKYRQKTNFPNFKPDAGKMNALESLTMNNANLLGPNLEASLNANDTQGTIKEILLNSNKDSNPGLQKRRIGESEEFAGPEFENIVDNLSDKEKYEIRDIIMSIKNINERNRVLEQYPFLNKIYNPRWGRIPQE